MRIKILKLENFRGFEDLTIDFPEGESGLAVFVGVNGSGKTSVLEGITKLLHSFFSRLYEEPIKSGQEMERNELGKINSIKNGEINASLILNLNTSQEEFEIKEIIDRRTGITENSITPRLGVTFVKDRNIPAEVLNRGIRLLENPFLITFYSSKRSIKNNIKLTPLDISNLSTKDAFKSAFLSQSYFEDFFNWFRNAEDIENRKRLREDQGFRLTALETVRKAISIFLPFFSNPYVETTQHGEEIFVEKNGDKLSISQLSDGEKSTIAMISDIARRLSIINPNNPLQGKGVVLIDEIEQHLHPGWQRTIIPNLRRTFPNIQFIVTTHSPQVISTLQKENVFILDDFKLVKDTPHTYGRDANSILWEIFGVEKRTPEAKKEFEKLYRLMDYPEKNKETEKMLREAESKYGYYDAEVIRAREQFEYLNED